MWIPSVKTAALAVAMSAMIAADASPLARPSLAGDEPPTQPRTAGRSAPAEASRMTVVGRVVDPSGEPVAGARVAAVADRVRQVGDIDGHHLNNLKGTTATDARGRFTLEFPAIPSDRLASLSLIAAAPGRALAFDTLKPDAARQESTITLAPEAPVEGRLVDVQGQPAPGVVVRVAAIRGGRHDHQPYDPGDRPNLWPAPATTDANGRFRLLGLGADLPTALEVDDPRFARQAFAFHAGIRGATVYRPGSVVTLQPAQTFEVRVVRADDGKPAAGARVDVQATNVATPTLNSTHARTDADGVVRVVGWPASRYRIDAYPAADEPYLPGRQDLQWPRGAVRHSVELKLPRGVTVRGRLIEEPASIPVAGGWIGYQQTRRGNARTLRLPRIEAVSGPDGTFTMVVPPGPGHLLVQGPTADYLHVTTNNVEMGVGLRPSLHLYPDAHAVLDIKDGEATHPIELRLHRGVTVAGRVVAPDGTPVAEAITFGRSYVWHSERSYPMTTGNGSPPEIAVKGGRFEVPGCDPETPVTFYFLDVKDHLGGTAEISGRLAAKGPIAVRLRPTASTSLLLKRPDGKVPDDRDARRVLAGLRLIITPGPDWEEINKNIDVIPGDFAYQLNVGFDPDNRPHPGPDGRVTVKNLIPGARYRFRGREFTPEPGQTIDLGEVVVEKP